MTRAARAREKRCEPPRIVAGRPVGRLRRAGRTSRTRRGSPAVKPPRFDYVRAASGDEAIEVLAAHGDDARVLAGGQSLVAMLSMRLLSPAVVVDISRVPRLQPSTARWTRSNRRRSYPGQGPAVRRIGRAPAAGRARCRSSGTARPAPAARYAARSRTRTQARRCRCASRALDGEVVLRSARGTRVMAAADFQQGMLTTACAADEMMVSVRFPRHICGDGCAFDEFGIRHGDFAIVAVAGDRECGAGPRRGGRLLRSTPRSGPPAARRRCARREAERPGVVAAVRRRSPRQRALPSRSGAHPGEAGRGEGDPVPKLSADTRHRITVTLNGRGAEGLAEPRLLLSDFLRHALGATGVHVGCEHGVCGACTVRIDDEPARSCLILAVQADGSTIIDGCAERRPGRTAARRHRARGTSLRTAALLGGLPGRRRVVLRQTQAGLQGVVVDPARALRKPAPLMHQGRTRLCARVSRPCRLPARTPPRPGSLLNGSRRQPVAGWPATEGCGCTSDNESNIRHPPAVPAPQPELGEIPGRIHDRSIMTESHPAAIASETNT